MTARTKAWLLAVVGLLGVIGALGGIKASQIMAMIRAGESFTPPPESVTSSTVKETMWQSTQSAVGSLVADRGVTLGTEVPGRVRRIAFDSGTTVKKGDLLVQLDSSIEQAQLDAALADAALARITLGRAEILERQGSTTQADLDVAQTRAKQAEATVAALRATIDKKTIRAPFAGRISIRQVELGQVLSPGDPIASLQSVTPIHAEFWLPQQVLASLHEGQATTMTTDTFGKDAWKGRITTINPEIDPATRNVRIRATFDNEDGRLRPGMFARVEVIADEHRAVLMIPATAVLHAPYGDSVFVIEDKKGVGSVARQRFVRVGERRGDFVSVSSGLSEDETIVSSGAFKLRNGTKVVVDNSLALGADMSPNPSDL